MTPTASPRHPWKALAAVLAMFAVVHGARAHVDHHPLHDVRVVVGHGAAAEAHCRDRDEDVDVDDGDDDDMPLPDVDFDDDAS